MLNVFQGVVKYGMGDPWHQAARELATHPETGKFMKQGEYAVVELPTRFVFPIVFLTFIASNGVEVSAGEDFACFEYESTRHCLWRVHALKNHPDEPVAA